MSSETVLGVARLVVLSPIVFSMRQHYRAAWLVDQAFEFASECVKFADENGCDPVEITSFVLAKYGQGAIKNDTLKLDYMFEQARKELVEDESNGLLKEFFDACSRIETGKAEEHDEVPLAGLTEVDLQPHVDPSSPADDAAPKSDVQPQVDPQTSANATKGQVDPPAPSGDAQPKVDEPQQLQVEQAGSLPTGQQPQTESQQAGSDSPLKGIAVADLKIDSKFRKALIAAGLNTAQDVVDFHQKDGLASLPVLGEKSANFILGVIEGLKG